jgi:hypothetical protein
MNFTSNGGRFQFRLRASGPHPVLVSLEVEDIKQGKMSLIGPKCRIDSSVPGGAAPIVDEEWDKALPLEPFGETDPTRRLIKGSEPDVGSSRDPRRFDYKGHLFEKSGGVWDGVRPVLLSPGEALVALQSWNGTIPFGNSGEGNFYVDFYNASTGAQLAVIKGYRDGWTPDSALRGYWIGGRDFVQPFLLKASFLLCHFEN